MKDCVIECATQTDVDELLRLYFLVYQNNYPLPLCSDRQQMSAAISSSDFRWYVTRNKVTGQIVGSAVFEMELFHKIGKLTGVVVHPDYRQHHVAIDMIKRGTQELLGGGGPLHSIYTTTRTVSRGPQIMVLKDGFIPLGIFPNAHKLKEYETLTLMAKFREGILEKRPALPPVPEKIAPIVKVLHDQLRIKSEIPLAKVTAAPRSSRTTMTTRPEGELDFELIDAPKFVLRRFNETFTDPYDRFFPFHIPNLLISSTNGEVEIFAYLNHLDGYLTVVALNVPIYSLGGGRLRPLLNKMRSMGVSYIEVLIGLEHAESLQVLVDAQFLPSAIYPAMIEIGGQQADFLLMTRTLEPLNFVGMQVERSFKPYLDQYIELWKAMHLETLEVFNEYR
jgi:hypothetical protein